MSKTANKQAASVENVFKLDGRVPLIKAVPFGLQHILAMFVANLTPITIIAASAGLDNITLAILLQNAMIAAGLATFIPQQRSCWLRVSRRVKNDTYRGLLLSWNKARVDGSLKSKYQPQAI